MTQLPRFLTAEEVAERYDTTAETIRRWAREDRIPAVKMPSGRVKFRRSVIDELMPPDGDTPDVPVVAGDCVAGVEPPGAPATPPAKSA